ncbi:hypothetical protein EV193_101580 [Herbihabitans rhizosphaerae]|uniref:Cytochrome P450 n=1 Tax=Herbihabitans rhizosphaerae TaxID=1872711 RepID=A0A4Q7L5Y9_9PSEU|nr:cytochrome P450 [Herbihabitans rhizosphaerae]RZS44704.1 hypothetical protein EV193_101580 [Herbihabitans rhizosphaerae]
MTTVIDGPVFFDETLDAFVVVGHDAANEVLRGGGWSSDLRNNVEFLAQFGGPDAVPELLTRMVVFMDPPGHTRIRRLVAPAFGARRIESIRDRIAAIVDAAVAGLSDVDEAELVDDFAYPLAIATITELLDVGVDGAQLIFDETPRLIGLLEVGASEERVAEAAGSAMTCSMFLLPLIEDRRRAPGGDLISALLTAEVDGERLDTEDVLATVLMLLIAGQETTANLIGNAVLTLLRHPMQSARLRREPELIGTCVEEVLRLDGSVKLVGRTALVDQTVAGTKIVAGQQVFVRLAAANRDPARFAGPDAFDIGRTDTGHLAFGAGPHFCLGWALARTETEEAISRLFAAFPDLRLTREPAWRDSTTFHGLDELPVRLRR